MFVFVWFFPNIFHPFIFIKMKYKIGDIMNISKKTKKAGIYTGALTAIIVVIIGIYTSGLLDTSVAQVSFPDEHLFVDAAYLLKTDENNETVNVSCNLYLTNIWEKESGEIKATAFVIETINNLAVYKNTVEIGVISKDSTSEIEVPIILSNNSYKVDILIFENNKLVLKGTLTIDAYPVYVWDDISHGMTQVWNLKNNIYDFEQIH